MCFFFCTFPEKRRGIFQIDFTPRSPTREMLCETRFCSVPVLVSLSQPGGHSGTVIQACGVSQQDSFHRGRASDLALGTRSGPTQRSCSFSPRSHRFTSFKLQYPSPIMGVSPEDLRSSSPALAALIVRKQTFVT